MPVCDRCRRRIPGGSLRYIVKIQVYAASDPLEITDEELRRNHAAEIQALLRQCEDMTEEELMRDVWVEFNFTLCRPCQKEYLARPAPLQASENLVRRAGKKRGASGRKGRS